MNGALREHRRFDWRMALPVVTAAIIAVAGYLSLRPPAPGEVALDALSAEDLAALVEVARNIVPEPELLPDAYGGWRAAFGGALEAGWIRADGPPGWGDLDRDDLEGLREIVG
jgi:hypothetical protein